MKKLFLMMIAVSIILSSCENSSETEPVNKGDIIPLAVGNMWIYQVIRWEVDTSYTKWEITGTKTIPVIYPDSSESTKEVFLCNIIEKYDTHPDSGYVGFYKDNDGVVMLDINEEKTEAYYFLKIFNEYQLGWSDPYVPWFYIGGKEVIQTPAGTYDCIEFFESTVFVSFYCKGVGLVANFYKSTETMLFSFELK